MEHYHTAEAVVPTTIIDLGTENRGAFGPTPETNTETLYADAARAEYHQPATDTWICVDGRGDADAPETNEADPQTPGSLPITNTAADFMDSRKVGAVRLSESVAVNTRRAIAHGKTVVVHGAVGHGGKAGCAANAKMRDTLAYGAANVDVVAPTVWAVGEAFGLDRWITVDDVTESITAGGHAAESDDMWDVTPEEAIDIAVENGAQYAALPGDHNERLVGLEMDEDRAFNNRKFAQDHPDEHGQEQQAFGVALAKYVHETFAERIADGYTPRDAALHVARAVAYTTMLTKNIVNQDMRAMLSGTARPVELPAY